jgi:hypothetical protein
MKAASEILSKLKNMEGIREVTLKTEKLWEALIAFANTLPIRAEDDASKFIIPSDAMISSLSDLENIPVPTLNIPVSTGSNYRVVGELSQEILNPNENRFSIYFFLLL